MAKKTQGKANKSQKQCDALLTPIMKLKHPICELNGLSQNCNYYTQVAHHHCHKAKSLNLRYDENNLIALCSHCHVVLHYNESYWASILVKKKGLKWFNYIEKNKNTILKPDYNVIYETLQLRLEELKNPN